MSFFSVRIGKMWSVLPVLVSGFISLTGTAHADITFRSASSAGQSAGSGATSISFVNAGTAASATGSNVTPGLPSGLAANDLLFCMVASRDNVVPSFPSGWTSRYSISNGTDLQSSFFWKLAGSSESAPTVTFSGTTGVIARCFAFRGVDTSSPFDVAHNSAHQGTVAGDDKMTTGALTTATAGAMILIAGYADAKSDEDNGVSTGGGLSWSQDYFSRYDPSGNTNDVALGFAYAGQSAAAAIGPLSLDTDRNADNQGVVLALRPASALGLTITKPAGTVDGDVMVATVSVRPKTITIAAPSGWTQLQTHQSTNADAASVRMTTWYKVAASEGGSYTWSFGGGTHTGAAGGIVAYSGVDTASPVNVSGGNTTVSGYTHRANSITTTASNAMLVSAHAFPSITNDWTAPAGMTEAVDAASNARPDTGGISMEMNYKTQASAGASGNFDAVAASAGTDAGYGVAHLVALRPIPTISIATPATGTNENSGPLNFTVSLSATSSSTVTATYAFANGTATGGSSCTVGIDYINTGGTVSISAWSTTGTLGVTLCGDTTYEGDETFTVTLSNPSNATLGTSTATGTMLNDDTAPTLTIANVSVTEGNSGTTSMTLTVTQSAASGLNTTVNYATTAGTATAGASCSAGIDYVTTSGALTIATGTTSNTISVSVCGDTPHEASETFSVALSSPTNATLGAPSSATGTIVDDDAVSVRADYRFDECSQSAGATVADSGGNGYNGQMLGSTAAATGKINNAGDFSFQSTTTDYDRASLNYQALNGLTDLSVSMWIKSGALTSGTLPSLLSAAKSGYNNEVLLYFWPSNGKLYLLLHNSSGAGATAISDTLTIFDNNWHHIVWTRTGDTNCTYVDGALSGTCGTGLYSGALSLDSGGLIVGQDQDTVGGNFSTTQDWEGQIDELIVFDNVLTAAEIATGYANQNGGKNWDGTTRSAVVCGPDHVRLVHDGSAIACSPESVTVQACADANCSSFYTGGVSGNVTAGTNSVAFSIAGGASTTTTSIHLPTATSGADPQTVSLGANAISPTASNTSSSYYCNNGTTVNNTTACNVSVNKAGFLFDVPTLTAGIASGAVSIQAVKSADSTTCIPLFQSVNRTVAFWGSYQNPSSGTLKVQVNGSDVETTSSPAYTSTYSLAFDATGIATLTSVRYDDVGQMQLGARYMGSTANTPPDGGMIVTGSDSFVVKPYGFVLSNIQQTALPNLVNPAAADASGAKFVKAGEAFSVTAKAVTADGTTATPNYGKETAAESIKLTSTLAVGLGLTNNPAISGSFGAFSSGAATGTAFTWSDVGIITLTPSVGDGDYLGAGDVTGPTSGNVGRFYPDHFTMTTDTNDNKVAPACGTFSYMAQPFSVNVKLEARNTATAKTSNYSGAFAKGTVAFAAENNDAGTDLIARLSGLSGGSWSSGTYSLTSTAAVFNRNATPDGPFDNLSIGVKVVDAEVGTAPLQGLDMKPDATGNCVTGSNCTHKKIDADTKVRFGRLRLSNKFSSEKSDLSMDVQAQYWTGSSWIKATDDTCTLPLLTAAGAKNAVALSNYASTGGTPSLAATNLDSGHIFGFENSSGNWSLKLTKPDLVGGKAPTGSVSVAINLGSGTADQSCLADHPATTGLGASWLRSRNGGKYPDGTTCPQTYDRDPSARATFGLYSQPEHKRTVHVREQY